MIIVNKCDICGKISEVWRETNFTVWIDNDAREIKNICLDCTEILEEKIYNMTKNYIEGEL